MIYITKHETTPASFSDHKLPGVAYCIDTDIVHFLQEDQTISFEPYVDLGLPSGTLWASCNVGAEKPWEYGKYFQWGDTVGYYDNEEHNFTNGYKYLDSAGNLTKYNTSMGYGTVDNRTTLLNSGDAAYANMGAEWKMPTITQLQELFTNTNQEWIISYQGSGIN